jgi:NAD(P)-dependent dehydrogenase (short-subunit alcohol dehydrogenase family)
VNLTGKIVVVTGSTRGIGRAIAEASARHGATVVVSSRSAGAVEKAVAEMTAWTSSVSGFVADVAHWEEVEALKAHALASHGRIDVWFNNAGVSNGYRPLDEEGNQELHDLITINVLGHMYGAKAMIPYFREHGGYLMNMCGRGWKGEGTPFTTAYAASKAAIASLTRSLAEENKDAKNVSINAFVPGMVDTDFYVDMKTSPRLERTKGNVRLALDAFGTPIDQVGERAAALISATPGQTTGKVYAMLSPRKLIGGGAKMAWWGMTGKMKRA